MLHHTKSCQQVLPLGSDPAALALRLVCSSVPPSLHGSGTCRAFPHHRNFPAQVAAPVVGQPEVPQLGAPACRSCSQGQSDSAEQHRDQDRQGLAQRGCSPAAGGRTLRKAWSAPQEGSVPQHGGKAGTGQPPAEQRALWLGTAGLLGYHTQGAARSKRLCAPQRHQVLYPGQPRDTCPENICLAEKPWSNCRLRETPCNVPMAI